MRRPLLNQTAAPSKRRRRIAITGGLGFIGTKLVHRLAAEHELLVVDNLHPQVHADRRQAEALPTGVSFLEGDVTSPADMQTLARFAPSTVIHLAAETGTGQSLLQSRRHADVNVTGTATLLDALSSSGSLPDRVVIASSRAIYGEGDWTLASDSSNSTSARTRDPLRLAEELWTPEGMNGEHLGQPLPHRAGRTEPRPSNVYAATKLAQENIVQAWGTGLGVPTSVLRLQNVYGDGQATNNPYTGVLTYMAKQAVLGEQIKVFEGGGVVRDFVNVSDVADAIIRAALDDSSRSLTVDVGSSEAVTLEEVAIVLANLANAPHPTLTSDFRAGDVRAAFADTGAAKDELGFSPRVGLKDGLQELLDWVRAEARK